MSNAIVPLRLVRFVATVFAGVTAGAAWADMPPPPPPPPTDSGALAWVFVAAVVVVAAIGLFFARRRWRRP